MTVAACALVAGCGSETSGDAELRVFLSAPLSGPRAADGQDIADGAELALTEAGGEAAGVAVMLDVLDGAAGRSTAAAAGANARAATRDSRTIAYIGELESGATRTSLPIANEAGILQVSAGGGAEDLVAPAIGSEQVPVTQPNGTRTFGRVIPSDSRQGEALAGVMASEGVETVELIGSDDSFSEALVTGVESAESSPEIAGGTSRGRAGASLYALEDLVSESGSIIPRGTGPIYGSDALLDRDDLTSFRILTEACRTRTSCPGSPREIRLVSAAMDPTQLPAAGADFLAAFEEEYGRSPGRHAAYGYEAMSLVLDSIERAEDPLDRGAVVDAFFATTDRESILGTYSIDDVGNTTLGSLGAYEIVKGKPRPEPEALSLP